MPRRTAGPHSARERPARRAFGGALLEVSLSGLMQTRLSLIPPGLMGTCTLAAPLVYCAAPRRAPSRGPELGRPRARGRSVGGSSALAGRRRPLGPRGWLPGGEGLGAAGRLRRDRLGVLASADLH